MIRRRRFFLQWQKEGRARFFKKLYTVFIAFRSTLVGCTSFSYKPSIYWNSLLKSLISMGFYWWLGSNSLSSCCFVSDIPILFSVTGFSTGHVICSLQITPIFGRRGHWLFCNFARCHIGNTYTCFCSVPRNTEVINKVTKPCSYLHLHLSSIIWQQLLFRTGEISLGVDAYC